MGKNEKIDVLLLYCQRLADKLMMHPELGGGRISPLPFSLGKGDAMINVKWLKAATIRAVRTIAQTAIATIGTSVLMSDVNWLAVLSASILAGILSLLTSLAGLPEVKDE